MEEVPKIVTERLRAAKPEAHLDANLLAAFAEKSLTSREQAQVLEHLAGCALCRDVVAHAHPEPAMQQVAAAPAKKRQPWFQAAALRWGALAACVAIVGTLVIGRSSRPKTAPFVETAAKREVTMEAKLEPAAPPPSPQSESSRVSSADKKATQPAPGTRAESDANQLAWTTSNSTVNRIDGAQNEKRPASAGLAGKSDQGNSEGYAFQVGRVMSPPTKAADHAKNLDETVAHGGPLTRDRQDKRAFDRLDSFAKLQPGAAAPGSSNGAQSAAMGGISGNKPASPTAKADLARVLPPSPQPAPKLADKESAAQVTTAANARKAPAAAAETVQVTAGAGAVAPPPPLPTPAKIESAAVEELRVEGRNVIKLPEQQKQTSENNSGVLFKSKGKEDYGAIHGAMRSGLRLPLPRWQISAEGKLLRSNDAGDTWQPVPVADNIVFRVLSVAGSQLWIGGAQGNLFHSADSGGHWEQVKPAASGKTLSSDITGIEFPDPQHGKLSTADRQTWTTTDGGLSWQQQ
jgi:hypothetical protein